jgi:mannose-6-phosphate isomerase-like protein (cupin superfamily)
MKFNLNPFQEKVPKPWGEEIIITPKDLSRTGKILFIKAGKKLSLQYHDQKEETLCLFSGKALIWLENDKGEIEKIPMAPRHGHTVKPMQKHRVEALEDCYIFEVSSSEVGTTFRLEDEYRRPDETEDLRAQKNRGWKE